MRGFPLARATGPDGRWEYTLYDGGQVYRGYGPGKPGEPFVHAIDRSSGARSASTSIGTSKPRTLDRLQLQLGETEEAIEVVDPGVGVLGTIDIATGEATEGAAERSQSSGGGRAVATAVLIALALAVGVGVMLILRRRPDGGTGEGADPMAWRRRYRAGDNRPVLFELDQVRLSRAGRQVLDGFTAGVPDRVSALVGPSGSGKSTVLRLLDRLADPDSGTVRYRGDDVRELDALELRREVCLVPQLPALLEGTVADNVRFAAELAGREAGRRRGCSTSPGSIRPSPSATPSSSRSASSSGRCSPGRWRSSRGCCCSTSRPRRSTSEARDAIEATLARAARAARASRSCSSPTISRRRGGWPTGSCGSRAAASSSRARSRRSCWPRR